MVRIGVTGLMASGKSTVARRFEARGASLVEGDRLGWVVLRRPEVRDAVLAAFGERVRGGSGGWQISQTDSFEDLSVDCVVEGRSESEETLDLFHRAIRGESLPRFVQVSHPTGHDGLLTPQKRTTFGVVEMTTGCGRRCNFCLPDLNPQIDFPKEKIMDAVRANVREGNSQISLATEDMFIWGQVHTDIPFYFPNREALVDLYRDVVGAPGVRHHLLSHCTMAPSVVDPKLIE